MMMTMDLKGYLQRLCFYLFYNSWGIFNSQNKKGYSIILPMPGKLPVFLRFGFDWLKLQKKDNLVEILIIPDKLTKGFYEVYKEICRENSNLPLRLIPLGFFERLINYTALFLGDVHKCYSIQVVRSIRNAASEYLLLNDADIFIFNNNFIEKQYQTCLERDLFCLGITNGWDDWFKEQGINHIVGTCQIMFNKDWIMSFFPFQIFPQKVMVKDAWHNFDTFFLIQYLTDSAKILNVNWNSDFVHFESSIATFRKFRREASFHDAFFRILFIRIITDAYSCSYSNRYIPDLKELISGINSSFARVVYLYEDIKNYLAFRTKIQKVINSGVLEKRKIEKIKRDLDLFENHIL